MNIRLAIVGLLISLSCAGQTDTTKWIRAFPITDYILDASDSVKIVQIKLPYGFTIAEKQIGLLKGIYRDNHADTATIGAGRCNLIKGEYYYFTINYKQSGKLPRDGDLVYVIMDKTPVYHGNIIRIASQFIGLQDVYEKALYDRYTIFARWEKKDEEALVDSMVADIHFTGKYFLDSDPSMNVKIKSGRYEGRMVLNMMIACTKKDVTDFFSYMIARPRLYAGRQWKISEIFATWLSEGAPVPGN